MASRDDPRSLRARIALIVGTVAVSLATAVAADPLAPRLPWSPGGWTATNWLGFAVEVGLFLLAAALILRLGRPPVEVTPDAAELTPEAAEAAPEAAQA